MNDLLNMSDEQFLEFANNSFVSVSIPQIEKTKISYSKYYKLLEDSKTNCHKLKFNFETVSNLTESVLPSGRRTATRCASTATAIRAVPWATRALRTTRRIT